MPSELKGGEVAGLVLGALYLSFTKVLTLVYSMEKKDGGKEYI